MRQGRGTSGGGHSAAVPRDVCRPLCHPPQHPIYPEVQVLSLRPLRTTFAGTGAAGGQPARPRPPGALTLSSLRSSWPPMEMTLRETRMSPKCLPSTTGPRPLTVSKSPSGFVRGWKTGGGAGAGPGRWLGGGVLAGGPRALPGGLRRMLRSCTCAAACLRVSPCPPVPPPKPVIPSPGIATPPCIPSLPGHRRPGRLGPLLPAQAWPWGVTQSRPPPTASPLPRWQPQLRTNGPLLTRVFLGARRGWVSFSG